MGFALLLWVSVNVADELALGEFVGLLEYVELYVCVADGLWDGEVAGQHPPRIPPQRPDPDQVFLTTSMLATFSLQIASEPLCRRS